MANLARVAMINVVVAIVVHIGKASVAIATTALAAAILVYAEPYKSELTSVLFPLGIIFLVSFFVAWCFMVVYDTAVDTIFLCFLVDEEMNAANGTMMADQELRDMVQKFSKETPKKEDAAGGGAELGVVKI
eukprot:TRINITY_DN4607_c0_g1_i1.p1 TRINITY_DN4607_c0_g1~~TRINITY_DN4607_c0_g1_i1.p1  ORF type:complete len:148 (+),score=25.74 TRINITY_DN4607_c0_g1_i1:51-446(+)